MFSVNRSQRSGLALRTGRSTLASRTRRTGFELLDERVVLSAAPVDTTAALLADDIPEAAPLASFPSDVSNPAQATLPGDVTVIMSGSLFIFKPEDFGILDPVSVTGVKIVTLPLNGAMTLSSVAVTAGQIISYADLNAGNLRFLRTGPQFGPSSVFGFQLQDGSPSPITNSFTLYFNTPQVNFINHLYQDILNRNAEAGGLTHWVDQSSLGMTNEQIASNLWGSVEHRNIQVDGYYHQFLDRNPDAAGRTYWVNQMLNGLSEAATMAAFMSTVEYQLNHPTTVSLITGYYEDLFNRAPDQNGLNYWTAQINTNQQTVHQAATNLVNTRERHLILVDTYYEDYLSRAPEQAGRLYWTEQLDSGALNDRTFALAIFSTTEYFNQ